MMIVREINDFLHGRAHQSIIEYQIVNPEKSVYVRIVIQIDQVTDRNIFVCVHVYILMQQ